MSILQGKKILITGMISERSIAYGIAKACREQGAELAFTYVVDKLEERVRKLAAEFGSELVFRCDVQSDEEIAQTFADLGKRLPAWASIGMAGMAWCTPLPLRPKKRSAATFWTASAAKPLTSPTKFPHTACPRWQKPLAR